MLYLNGIFCQRCTCQTCHFFDFHGSHLNVKLVGKIRVNYDMVMQPKIPHAGYNGFKVCIVFMSVARLTCFKVTNALQHRSTCHFLKLLLRDRVRFQVSFVLRWQELTNTCRDLS